MPQDTKAILLELQEELNNIPTAYPEDIFSEPWEGWQNDLHEFAKSKGKAIDNITAHFARWQESLMKERFSSLITETINKLEE